MKKTVLILITCLIGFWAEGQTIKPVPADKSVVYFVRPSGLWVQTNFTYYDGDKAIGRFNAPKYMRYECEPGEHVFWVSAQNKSFIKADLAPGKIYLVEAVPIMGILKSSVRLEPIDPKEKKVGRFRRLISNHKAQKPTKRKLEELARLKRSAIVGMRKYQQLEKRNHKFKKLSKEMYIKPEELILK